MKSRALAMQVSHHLLLSHGLALQALRAQGCKARLGIVLNLSPTQAVTDSEADQAKAQLDDGRLVRWYMDPLFKGRYPDDVLEHLGADAPRIGSGDMAQIAAPMDFLGVNYYTRNMASAGAPFDASDSGCGVTDMGWEIYPQGLTELLLRLHRDYPVPPMYVTENGAAFKDTLVDGRVHDVQRTDYIAGHIAAVGEALRQGVRDGGLHGLEPARQLRMGLGLRQALRHRACRLRHAGAHAEGQRAVVPRVPARPAREAPAAAGHGGSRSLRWARSRLRNIRKSYGAVDVIKGIDLDVNDGEFLVFVGPSGCGKSTVLRMIAGLESVSSGELLIDGERANELRPADRGAAMVFQSYALYPHMTVAENMGFALKMAGVGKAERDVAGRPRRRDPAHHRAAGPLPEGAVGRPAPARGHRPRHRAQAQGLPVR